MLEFFSINNDNSEEKKQKIYNKVKEVFDTTRNDMDLSCKFSLLQQSNSICANKLNSLLTSVRNFVPQFLNPENIHLEEIEAGIKEFTHRLADIWNLEVADQLSKDCL